MHEGKSRENQAAAFQNSVPMQSVTRVHSIPLATTCENVQNVVCQGSSAGTVTRGFCQALVLQASSAQLIPKFKNSRRGIPQTKCSQKVWAQRVGHSGQRIVAPLPMSRFQTSAKDQSSRQTFPRKAVCPTVSALFCTELNSLCSLQVSYFCCCCKLDIYTIIWQRWESDSLPTHDLLFLLFFVVISLSVAFLN